MVTVFFTCLGGLGHTEVFWERSLIELVFPGFLLSEFSWVLDAVPSSLAHLASNSWIFALSCRFSCSRAVSPLVEEFLLEGSATHALDFPAVSLRKRLKVPFRFAEEAAIFSSLHFPR